MTKICKRPLTILLFFIAATALLLPIFNYNSASASTVSVGNALFSENQSMTISGAAEGLLLTSKVKTDASAKYVNQLYFKDFILRFQINKEHFQTLKLTVQAQNYDDSTTGVIKDEDMRWDINIKKSQDGVSADINGEDTVEIQGNITDIIEIKFNEDNKFTIKAGNRSPVTIEKVIPLDEHRYEGFLTFAMLGREVTKQAELAIKNLNNQIFTTQTAGYVEDNAAPVLRIIEEQLVNVHPANIQYKLPIYGMDVLSGNISYNIKIGFSQDGTEYDEEDDLTFTSATIDMIKAGHYKVKEITAKDGNGNQTSSLEEIDYTQDEIIIQAIPQTQWKRGELYLPRITEFTDNVKKQAYIDEVNANRNSFSGEEYKFQFAAPEYELLCLPEGITEEDTTVKYILHYKREGTTWSQQDGLLFTARYAAVYDFKIQIEDVMGNKSDLKQSPILQLEFSDITPPKIYVTEFPVEKYVNQQITLPTATVTDDTDSGPAKEIKIYYILDENENEVLDEEQQKILVSESATFTPEKLGWYEVIYTAVDSRDNSAEAVFTLNVVEIQSPVEDGGGFFIDFDNPWNIVFLSVAALSAIGLIVVMFIKPKENA